jgi:transposase
MRTSRKDESKEACIARMREQNLSYATIQQLLKVSPKRISRVIASIRDRQEIPDTLSRGPPVKVKKSVIEEVNSSTLDEPTMGGHRLAKKINELLGIQLSTTTINSIRSYLHFRFTSPRRRQLLTPAQEDKRYVFAEKQLMSTIDWTRAVIITDESRFCLHADNRRVWMKRGIYNTGTFHSEEKFSKSIMVWGAIGQGWKSPLIVIRGNLNTDGYLNLLEENKILDKLNAAFGE